MLFQPSFEVIRLADIEGVGGSAEDVDVEHLGFSLDCARDDSTLFREPKAVSERSESNRLSIPL